MTNRRKRETKRKWKKLFVVRHGGEDLISCYYVLLYLSLFDDKLPFHNKCCKDINGEKRTNNFSSMYNYFLINIETRK